MVSPSQNPPFAIVLMLATCSGAKPGASSITTRPLGNSMYRVLAGSRSRQALAGAASMISCADLCLGGWAPSAAMAGAAMRVATAKASRAWRMAGILGESGKHSRRTPGVPQPVG